MLRNIGDFFCYNHSKNYVFLPKSITERKFLSLQIRHLKIIFTKYLVGLGFIRTFATVKQSKLKYNYMHTMCGGRSEKSSIASHPNHHTCNSTADNTSMNGGNVSGASFLAKVNVKYIAKSSRSELLAVAFVATVRAYEGIYGARYSYTVNALHELTGVHAQTICKRVATLKRMGLAIEENGKICLLSVKSKHSKHNVQLGIEIGSKALKNAEKAVLQERFMNKLRQIDYYRNAISRYKDFSNNPKSKVTLAEYKKLNLWLRSHCKTDYRNGKFVNYGWSYKKIAEYLYVSIKTAVEIVKAVVESGRVIKKRNSMFKKLASSQEIEFIKHTFSFHGYSYKVYSNIYTLSPSALLGSAGTIRL